jgi:hypothetical protein
VKNWGLQIGLDDSMITNECSQMCQHKQDLGSVVGFCSNTFMYIQQRFVATEMEEFEQLD